jgi:hypothetical protein
MASENGDRGRVSGAMVGEKKLKSGMLDAGGGFQRQTGVALNE